MIFDGTTRSGEALAIIFRFVKEWKIQQRLVRLELLQKSMNGDEMARQLLNVIAREYGVPSDMVIATMRDRASVNEAAMKTVAVMYSKILDVGFFSYTLDHVGQKFSTPILARFIKNWISLFSHSSRARLLWKGRTGKNPETYSAT